MALRAVWFVVFTSCAVIMTFGLMSLMLLVSAYYGLHLPQYAAFLMAFGAGTVTYAFLTCLLGLTIELHSRAPNVDYMALEEDFHEAR